MKEVDSRHHVCGLVFRLVAIGVLHEVGVVTHEVCLLNRVKMERQRESITKI